MNSLHIRVIRVAVLAIAVLALLSLGVLASPPWPGRLNQTPGGKLDMHKAAAIQQLMRQKGICSSESFFGKGKTAGSKAAGESPGYTGTFKALAILVQFSDHASSVSAQFFDSLVFGTQGTTVHNFYDEISFGQLDMVTVNMPSSMGWKMAPETYAYYVNGQGGLGSYPQNSQKLVEDLVDIVNPVVDFSQYDNDHDGFVDCLLVIHAGSGAEFTYDNNDFHSHKWGIVPRLKDGVYVSSYTIQPEFWQTPGDMTIGVYAHELGHGFGLPDLYDTDYSSRGVGKWCLMSYGSWNGPNGKGGSPSHPCAWCLSQMGFATPTNITANTNGQIIPPVEATGQIYRLWNSGNQGNEYFLVENRQKMLSDTYLPGEGLLIWHIDESKSGNTQEWYPTKYNLQNNEHYLVALEQADGLYQLEDTSQPSSNYGDAGDPYPGNTNKTTFDAVTNPSSDSYTDGTSFVSVNNISVNGDTIQADLLVGFSAGVGDENTPSLPYGIELAQNYPNPFNPSTIISLSAEAPAKIKLDVFNTLGQHVKTLFDGVVGSGVSEFEWDGRNEAGHQVASGVYFYRLSQEGHVQTRRMVMLK